MTEHTWPADRIEAFVRDGFVHLPGAFDATLAGSCRDLLWAGLDADPADPTTWTAPVVRLPGRAE